MFDLAYVRAREMLQKNRRVLEKIVDELLEFEILTGKVKMLISVWDCLVLGKNDYYLVKMFILFEHF